MNLLFITNEDGTQEVVNQASEAPVAEQQTAETSVAETVTVAVDPTQATAEQAPQPAGTGWSFWLMIIAMIAIMYFFMWRPESKRRKQMETFRNNLKKGDKIITAGGIYGVVKEVQPTILVIEVANNVTLRIDKNMVAGAPGEAAK